MKIKKILFSVFVTGFMMVSMTAKAQFQGQVTMKVYGEENGNKNVSEINLYSTSNRIMIKGEDTYSFSDGSFDASGLLIRNDKKDFVVMMGEKEALQFTKEELEGLFSMMGMMAGDEDKEVNVNPNTVYTNKTRNIMGFDCTELLVMNEDNSNTLSIWLTSEIDINWGMLSEPWMNVPDNMKDSASRLTQEFKSKNFPMLVEVTEDGETNTIMEVTNVNKSSIAKAMVEIPAGVDLVGLQEMIFKMMMGN